MADGARPADPNLFGNLDWIYAFRSDTARLAAIALVCLTFITIFCLPALARTWAADRADQREHERKRLELIAAVDAKLARRTAERRHRDE